MFQDKRIYKVIKTTCVAGGDLHRGGMAWDAKPCIST